MKTVILIPQFFREGTTKQAYLLARELKQRHGLDVEVWGLFFSGECVEEFEAAGVPTRVLNFRRPQCPVRAVRMWSLAKRLLHIANEFRGARIDILLPFANWPNVIAGLTYRLAGVRLCIWGERSSGAARAGMERLAVRQYHWFIANSTAGIDFLTGEMGVSPSRISYVANAVEEPRCPPGSDWRDRLGIAPEQLLVLMVANLAHQRDHATLLHAWKIVQDAWHSNVKPMLILAGAIGDSFRDVQRFVRETRLESSVCFVGAVQDVTSLIDVSDLCVFSSRKEGMPNSVLEYMVAGKAVVATDLPGIRDALGTNDVLAPAENAEELASRIMDLLVDKTRRDTAGEANKARALSEFTVRGMAEKYLRIMDQRFRPSRLRPHRRIASSRPTELSEGKT
jgi:glycosyltransferase involved in cell wall biosynthesis